MKKIDKNLETKYKKTYIVDQNKPEPDQKQPGPPRNS